MRQCVVGFIVACACACSPPDTEPDAGAPQPSLDAGRGDAGAPPGDAGDTDGGVPDAGAPDAGVDAGGTDAGTPDAGADAGFQDAGTPDAGVADAGGPALPLPGFGAVSGACGPLALSDLTSPAPSTFETRLDFGMVRFDGGQLSDGGRRLFTTPNAGGSSGNSELFSFEVLHRCELAELFATETEVMYTPASSKKTDLVVRLEGEVVGVSVARAFKFPPGSPLTVTDARTLLTGKFSDIQVSSQNVNPPWRWRKQILHILAYDDVARQAVLDAAAQLDAGVRRDTILYVTTTDGDDAFIY
ncbi:MAG: hypothetical protein INH41_25160 [Myxococcaceae bacterium]|jgi:hypothetical protein|nr:hypothetical protein [Myxococcaceae bacterium]MCA3015690.1 hypothetical protein [Myxococcaceae bacterium]